MTDERDDELARRLAALQPPDHRGGFWSDVRAELTDPTDVGPDDVRGLVENGGVVELGTRRSRRAAPPRLLTAAAVALVAVVTAGVVLATGGRDDEADVATDPTVVDDPESTTTTTPGPLRPDGDPTVRGIGRPVAVDPTGTFLYVAAPAPDGGFGCEGAPAEALYVEFVDGTGERRAASGEVAIDATGAVEMRFGPEGTVALVSRCEGFGPDVVTGHIAENGEIIDTEELTIQDLDLGRPVDGITDLEFHAPGMLVATTWSIGDDGTEHRKLYSFPTSPSELTDVGQLDVTQVEVLADGQLLTADTLGYLRVGSAEPVLQVGGSVRALDVSGPTVVVVTDRAVLRVDLDAPSDGTEVLFEGSAPWVEAYDGGVVLAEGEGGGYILRARSPGHRDPTVLGQSSGGFVLSPAGGVVFYAGLLSDDSEHPLIEQRLAR